MDKELTDIDWGDEGAVEDAQYRLGSAFNNDPMMCLFDGYARGRLATYVVDALAARKPNMYLAANLAEQAVVHSPYGAFGEALRRKVGTLVQQGLYPKLYVEEGGVL